MWASRSVIHRGTTSEGANCTPLPPGGESSVSVGSFFLSKPGVSQGAPGLGLRRQIRYERLYHVGRMYRLAYHSCKTCYGSMSRLLSGIQLNTGRTELTGALIQGLFLRILLVSRNGWSTEKGQNVIITHNHAGVRCYNSSIVASEIMMKTALSNHL